jgi:hemolysin-activating ACP:hemolysin acyltransferase
MNYSLTTAGGKASDADIRQDQMLGAIVRLMSQSGFHARMTVHQAVDRLRMPICLGQVKVYFNDFGQCMGYLTWAYLTPDVENRVMAGGQNSVLQDFEWNEGRSLWVMDLLVPGGAIRDILVDMRDHLFSTSGTATYFRYKNGKRLCKRISRTDNASFWRSAEKNISTFNYE